MDFTPYLPPNNRPVKDGVYIEYYHPKCDFVIVWFSYLGYGKVYGAEDFVKEFMN